MTVLSNYTYSAKKVTNCVTQAALDYMKTKVQSWGLVLMINCLMNVLTVQTGVLHHEMTVHYLGPNGSSLKLFSNYQVVQYTNSSNSSTDRSSLLVGSSRHKRSSMSAVDGGSIILLNHGRFGGSQQVLPVGQPSPSQRGSSEYHWSSDSPTFPDSQK